MDYSKTVNLPRTDFSMRANLKEKEPEILSFWENEEIYKKLIERDGDYYILHDGPPYANGELHIGHALNKILKDFIVRFKSLSGYKTPFIPGWDCHGMPIEHKVTKMMKKPGTREEVRNRCRAYAEKYVNIQREQFKRLGIIGDWENPYVTYDKKYEADVLRVLKALLDDGYIYRERRPIHWCVKCKTALAEAELEYEEHISPSIFIRFAIKSTDNKILKNASFLVWTTTPWTIPANVALAVGKEIDYTLVETEKGKFILATTRLTSLDEIGLPYRKIQNIYGDKLKDIKVSHPLFNRESVVIFADFVSTEEGTGVVHIAPGHGYEDYLVGKEYNLAILSPVDEEGMFTEEAGEFSGEEIFSANNDIIKALERNNNLMYSDSISHSYPHCWRCGSPVIFRATPQWFVRIDHNELRSKCLDWVDKLQWVPRWSKERMRDSISNRPDWCISRQRNWGVPIPALYCEKCGNTFINNEIVERAIHLVEKAGSDAWFEGKGEIESGLKCPECEGERLRRENDILDVWFESSSSFKAVTEKRLCMPSDLYVEAVDQHRGWFQLSLILSIALREESPFRTCLTHGLVLDIEKKKMSKKLGNVMSPQVIVKQFGADILRLYFASVDYTRDMEFGEESLEAAILSYRKVRNTFRYALANLYDFDNAQSITIDNLLSIDRFILSTLQVLIKKVRNAYDEFDFHRAYSLLFNYSNITLSRFYYDILKDRLYTYGANSPERKSAQTVLHQLLKALSVLFSPILPFTTEEIWQKAGFVGSVHLQRVPTADDNLIDKNLMQKWEKLVSVRDSVLSPLEIARREKLIGNSLEAKVRLFSYDIDEVKILKEFESELPSLFIVSQVELVEKEADISGTRVNDVVVEIIGAEGKKCPRCWVYSKTIGQDPKHPVICSKCVKALQEAKR